MLKKTVHALLAVSILLAPYNFSAAQNEVPGNKISLDFEDVDIRSLIRFMAEISGENYIVDNKVIGKVTVISPQEVDRKQAMNIFANLLLASGYAIVPAGDVKQIVPASKVGASATPITEDTPESESDIVTRVIKPKSGNAKNLIEILKPMLSSSGAITSYGPANLLMVTDAYSHARRIEMIVGELDKASADGSVEMLPLKHIEASTAASIMERIFSSTDDNPLSIIPEATQNLLIVSADAGTMQDVRRVLKRIDVEAQRNVRSLDIIYLKHADATDMATVLNDLIEKTEDAESKSVSTTASALKAVAAFKGPVSVVADISTNALVLSADPSDMSLLKNIVEKLDIPRLQVYIEALVMEVSESISNQFGVEWRSADNLGSDGGLVPFGGQNFGGLNGLAENPLSLPTGFSMGLAGASITYRGTEYANIGALVTALEAETDVNILSTPQLLTMDNQEAEIVVGQNVPFVTGSYTTDGNTNPFQTIERKDVGINLRVKPQISDNGYVRLNLYQEISSVNASNGEAADITTRKRSLSTVVMVPNGNMVALGGLIQEEQSDNVQQVPCLGGLFGIGEAFKNTSLTNTKTNLMVFIKPHIIGTYDQMDGITSDKYKKMRIIQKGNTYGGTKMLERTDIGEADIIPEELRDTPPKENMPKVKDEVHIKAPQATLTPEAVPHKSTESLASADETIIDSINLKLAMPQEVGTGL